MIFNGKVPAQNCAVSQRNYNRYCLINGLSYMCLGETVLILLAVQMGSRDYLLSVLGSMLYIGFLLLPLGRYRCAKVGAATSMADFWVARNIAALLVACSGLLCTAGLRGTGLVLLLFGAFLFYGFRAAGVVLSQPLVGSITDVRSCPRLLGISNGLFYLSCTAALLAITVLLHFFPGIWTLLGVVVTGAVLGIRASAFLRRIDECAALRESSRKPLLPSLKGFTRDRGFMLQLGSGLVINLATILIVPLSMAALKRGCGVSDAHALLFTLVQFGASAAMSFASGLLIRKFGPRRNMLAGYILYLLTALAWACFPCDFAVVPAVLIFLTAGGTVVLLSNAVVQYYLQTIPQEKQVSYSIVVALVTNFGAGLIGMLFSSLLLYFFIHADFSRSEILLGYRVYFLCAMVVLLPGIVLIENLTPLKEEQRSRIGRLLLHHLW